MAPSTFSTFNALVQLADAGCRRSVGGPEISRDAVVGRGPGAGYRSGRPHDVGGESVFAVEGTAVFVDEFYIAPDCSNAIYMRPL